MSQPAKPASLRFSSMQGRSRPSPTRPPHPSPRQTLPDRRWGKAIALAALLGATGIVASGIRLSLEFIVDPQAVVWLNRFLPPVARIPITGRELPQTLTEIQASLTQPGLRPGEPLFLNRQNNPAGDFLLPVFTQQPNCTQNCERIGELRLYQLAPGRHAQSHQPYYRLGDQIPVVGVEESFVIAPLVNARSSNQGSTRMLPLTQLQPMENAPAVGLWLNLSGQVVQGDRTIVYGQILHYNPDRAYLSHMTDWTAPTGKAPMWQEATGGDWPELVVDQTVGMEPQFQVYQARLRQFFPSPVQLEAISLNDPALKHGTYSNALMLARHGLWSIALDWLESAKRQLGSRWPAAAQAQLDLVRLHSQVARSQANQPWASPSQQILANLVDGRWSQALQVWRQSSADQAEINALLQTDGGRLWQRVAAVLRVNPSQTEAKTWGALILTAQQGEERAIAWLQKQPKTPAAVASRIYALLSQQQLATATNANQTWQIAGSVSVLPNVNGADWLRPNQSSPLKQPRGQVWYQVQVEVLYDGQRWQQPPFPSLKLPRPLLTRRLWQRLDLENDPTLQLLFWLPDGQQEIRTATVQAVQPQGTSLKLLAAGEAPPKGYTALPRPLAVTQTALPWVTEARGMLADLTTQPAWVAKAMPALQRELQKVIPAASLPDWQTLGQNPNLNAWDVQRLDLTGNGQPDVVLTLDGEKLGQLQTAAIPAQFRPRTLIFSDTGTLIYNELGRNGGQSLVGIANLEEGGQPTLVVSRGTGYTLLRWSAQGQRFQ